jgi:hypothetical protein
MDFQGVEGRSTNWIDLARDIGSWRELVSAVLKLRVPKYAGNFLII